MLNLFRYWLAGMLVFGAVIGICALGGWAAEYLREHLLARRVVLFLFVSAIATCLGASLLYRKPARPEISPDLPEEP